MQATLEKKPAVKTPTITWETNYNGKMDCTMFLHIDREPENPNWSRIISKEVFTLKTIDKSHPPIQVKIFDIIPLTIGQLTNLHTWPSHGMYTSDFINWMHLRKAITSYTKLAVYYYIQIK